MQHSQPFQSSLCSLLGCGYKPGKCMKILGKLHFNTEMTFNDLTLILHLLTVQR
jgi:hypothetical protein